MPKIRPSLPAARHGLIRRVVEHRHFHRMMALQQIDLSSIRWSDAETSIYRALATCSHCPVKAACTAWFAGAESPMSYVRFCPNAERIETLRIMAA